MDIPLPRRDGPGHLDTLMARIAHNRDRAAFAELFRLTAPKVKAYLARLTNDQALAEEIAQEALLMVWQRAASFDPKRATFITWLYTIARNQGLNRLRAESPPPLDARDPTLQPEAPEDGETSLERHQQHDKLLLALATLPRDQAELIEMAYYQGKAHGDIAIECTLPLGTVKSRLRAGLAKLRRSFETP